MVGCVIVHEGKIIGEGWHKQYGQAHAEVNAIQSVSDHNLLPESTCYVTLEPCAHHGKTPPCADLLVSKKLKKVVIAAFDSNPLVGGKGIARMRDAGIEVLTGCLEEEARAQNCRFFSLIERKRPYVILKWAQTADGFVARKNFDSKWISHEYSRSLVHQWRAEEDAIMVGVNTAIYDDPALNVRSYIGKDPIRVLVDRNLKTPGQLKIKDQSIPTLVYNIKENLQSDQLEYVKLGQKEFLSELLLDLGKRQIQSVIIEGGAALLNAFIEAGLWDEARIFTAANQFEEGFKAPMVSGELVSVSNVLGDELKIYLNN